MGRSQKYQPRKRYIYALLFHHTHCAYIGQSIHPYKRLKQHELPSGGWCNQSFQMVVLGDITGTQSDAEVYEQAWRLKAVQSGWGVYGLPPNVRVDPRRKANMYVRATAMRLSWPREHLPPNTPWKRALAWIAGLYALATVLWFAVQYPWGTVFGP